MAVPLAGAVMAVEDAQCIELAAVAAAPFTEPAEAAPEAVAAVAGAAAVAAFGLDLFGFASLVCRSAGD